jgi:hypothetical protein
VKQIIQAGQPYCLIIDNLEYQQNEFVAGGKNGRE